MCFDAMPLAFSNKNSTRAGVINLIINKNIFATKIIKLSPVMSVLQKGVER